MAGVYLSYPFCAQKCTYCNFASGVLPRELESRYVETVLRELHCAKWPWTPETVYMGGGTPSSMDPAALASWLAAIPGRPFREATIEAAPGSIDRAKARAWVDAGINRVSLGVQSFVTRELARTGRKHTAATVASDVAILREAGIESISVDLIAGLPGQTAASWEESLDGVEDLDVPHASVYMLEVDEDSRLGREILLGGTRYGASDVPGEDEIAAMYETAVEQLKLDRYEISNFAKPGFESAHNLKYWKREPYLGFGADAHSFDGQWRWRTEESAAAYMDRPGAIDRTPADAVGERFYLGLRLAEGMEDWSGFEDVVDRFVREGLLEIAGLRLKLTPRGVLLSNEVFAEFVGQPVSPAISDALH
jgi:oxygen-independent coproporphyrinogen III oxidase